MVTEQLEYQTKLINHFQVMMDLTFSEAARGVNKEINVRMEDTCERCKGARAEPGTKTTKCHRCNGTGQVTILSSNQA